MYPLTTGTPTVTLPDRPICYSELCIKLNYRIKISPICMLSLFILLCKSVSDRPVTDQVVQKYYTANFI